MSEAVKNGKIKVVRIHGVDDVRVDDVDPPECKEGDVLVKVEACGICGSDLGYIAEGGTLFGNPMPMALGHEFAGIVINSGQSPSEIKVGQRVVVCPVPGVIGNGGPDGGFANYVRIPADQVKAALFPVPMSLPPGVASLAEPLSVGLHAVRRSGAKAGDKVVVHGVGCIGLSMVAGLRALNVEDIVAIDVSPFRLEAAKALGAKVCINAAEEDVGERLKKLHGDEPALGMLPAAGTDVFLDATAIPEVLNQTISMARSGAVITYVGLYKQDVAIDLLQVLYRELDLRASLAYSDDDFHQAINLLTDPDLDFTPMISHEFPIAEFQTALATAKNAHRSNKVIVTF